MIEIGTVASENTNLALKKPEPLGTANRTYAQFGKNEGADVAEATLSFDDFIDMINPLQHIPVLSSLYRGVAGESISPVSRIAGDALYGGVFGAASAGLSAAGAIGDEIVVANNDGRSMSGSLVGGLFGSEPSQIAEAAPTEMKVASAQETPKAAFFQTPATQSPILEMPDLPTKPTQVAVAPHAAAEEEGSAATSTLAAPAESSADKGMPLDRSKLAYGGAMDTSMLTSAKQNQALALALAGKRDAMQAQRIIHNSRFETATAAPAAVSTQPTEEAQNAMQALIKELQATKGANQYQNAAQNIATTGAQVNITN